MKPTRSLSEFSCLSKYTRLYPNAHSITSCDEDCLKRTLKRIFHDDPRRLGERSLNIRMSRLNIVRLYLDIRPYLFQYVQTALNMLRFNARI